MAEKVQIELTVEQAQAVNAWIRNNQAIVQNEESLRKLGEASEKAANKSRESFDQSAGAMDRLVQRVVGAVTVMGTLSTAAQLYRRELEAADRLNRSARDFQVDVGISQRKALLALGPTADLSQQELVAMTEERSRIPLSAQYQVLESAISGAGQLGARRGAETALAAGEFAPHLGAEDLRALASGAIELQKSFTEYDPRQAVAQVFQALSSARQESAGDFAKNIIPAIGQARAFGGGQDDFGFLASLFSAVGQRAGDPTGERSRTNVLNVLKQLKLEGTNAGLFDADATVEEQLGAIQGDSAEAQRLRGKLLGPLDRAAKTGEKSGDPKLKSEASTFVALVELLQAGSQTDQLRRQLDSTTGGTPDEVLARQEAFQRQINALPGQQAFQTKQILAKGVEQFRGDPRRALGGLARDELTELMIESGYSATKAEAESFVNAALSGGGTAEDQLQRIIKPIRQRELDVTHQTALPKRWLGERETDFGQRRNMAEAEAQAIGAKLDAVADLLEAQLQLMRAPPPVDVKSLPANQAPLPAAAAGLNDQ